MISPNGGERLEALTLAEVKINTGDYEGGADIYYSTNGGTSYQEAQLAKKDNQFSYTWQVPDEASAECLLKAVLKNNNNYFDVSDAFFTITPQRKITVNSPQTNELVEGGKTYTISWSSQGDIDQVDLFYSLNGGGNFIKIAEAEDNDGSFDWQVPAVNAQGSVIRISQSGDGNVIGESGVFQIFHNSITIIYPDKEKNWQVGRTYNIHWEYTGIGEKIHLYFDLTLGRETIVSDYNISSKEYEWAIPQCF